MNFDLSSSAKMKLKFALLSKKCPNKMGSVMKLTSSPFHFGHSNSFPRALLPAQTNQRSNHGKKKLSNLPLPPTYTHTIKRLQMTCMLPHCVGCEWLHTAEVFGVGECWAWGSWGESFSAKLSRGPESWSLSPVTLLRSGHVTTFFQTWVTLIYCK